MKVVLLPGGHVITEAFAISLTVREVKGHLASELKVPPEVLQICLNGVYVHQRHTLKVQSVERAPPSVHLCRPTSGGPAEPDGAGRPASQLHPHGDEVHRPGEAPAPPLSPPRGQRHARRHHGQTADR